MANLVTKTGQHWKELIQIYGFGIGMAISLFVDYTDYSFDIYGFPFYIYVEVIAFLCLVFPWVAIRCPRCAMRWEWQAVKENKSIFNSKWYDSKESCPQCKFRPQ